MSETGKLKNVQAKGKLKKLKPIPEKPPKGWAVCGFDTSYSSIAGAAMGYDAITKQMTGPSFVMRHFTKEDDYFERLRVAVRPEELIRELMSGLNILLEISDIWIAQEEPFPAHGKFTGRGISKSLKQQAEISGAFLGGLVRYGYSNIFQISNYQWRQLIAHDITDAGIEEVTIHHSKWRSPKLVEIYGCKPQDSGKFRSHQWARHAFEPWSYQQTQVEIPEFPHMIQGKDGKVAKPENSRAKPFQPDDRYDALAMMAWMLGERASLMGDYEVDNTPRDR